MVFSRTILGFIVSTKGKVMDPKKVETLVNMLVPTTLQEIQVFKGKLVHSNLGYNKFHNCFFPFKKKA
jgi:hypothetical protein